MTTPEGRPAVSAVLRRLALIALLVGGVALAIGSLAGQWDEVRAGAGELSLGYGLLSAVAVLLSLTFSLLSWRATLAGLGTPLPLPVAGRIFFVGQLGKYVPGSVWPVLAQMELGAGYGLSRAAVGTTALLSLALATPTALLLGLLALPGLLGSSDRTYLLPFLALPLTLVLLAPGVLNPLLARALRLARRNPLPQRLSGAAITRAALLAACAQLALGLHAALLAWDLGPGGAWVLPVAIGSFSLATVAGLLAVPVPAGAGVREAVLVLGLSPVLPVGQALLLALVSRALVTAGDVTAATVAARRTGQTGRETFFRNESNL